MGVWRITMSPRPDGPHARNSLARKLLLSLCTACSFFLVLAAGAGAFWGPGGTCYWGSSNENHHCYAIEEWKMAGYPREYGDGVVLDMDTMSTDVPGWASGDEVNDEVWLLFGANDYIETGQLTGRYKNCCSLYRFWSYTLHGEQITTVDPTIAPGGTYNTFEIYDPCHCGSWGIWWNGANPAFQGTQVAQLGVAGGQTLYPAWSKTLQGGMEAAANHQPYNWGKDEVASVEPPGDGWTEWESGYGVHSELMVSPHQCAKRNPESGHWGNIEFSTCVIQE